MRETQRRLQRQNEELSRALDRLTGDPGWAQSYAKLVTTLMDVRMRSNGQLECIEKLLSLLEKLTADIVSKNKMLLETLELVKTHLDEERAGDGRA